MNNKKYDMKSMLTQVSALEEFHGGFTEYRSDNGGTWIFEDGTVVSGENGNGRVSSSGEIYWDKDKRKSQDYIAEKASLIVGGQMLGIPRKKIGEFR